jgi:hypothetical protein
MTKFLNGEQIGHFLATNKFKKTSSQSMEIKNYIKNLFYDKFKSISLSLDNPNLNTVHKTCAQIIIQAKKERNIDPKLSYYWISFFLENFEKNLWEDCSAGQEAKLFVASNSSLLNLNVIFGGGRKIENKVMEGLFGLSFDLSDPKEIIKINDFVPFSYMISREHLPAAILFFGVADDFLSLSNKNCSDCSINLKIRNNPNFTCSSPVGLIIARTKKYIEDVQDAKHYADLDAYRHPSNDLNKFKKIPIIKAIYIKQKNEVYVLNNDCTIGPKLKDYLIKLDSKEFAQVIEALEQQEKNNSFVNLASLSLSREIGCVDARIRNILSPNGIIKEIGSVLNNYQMEFLADSKDISAILLSSHTNCGYLNTLYALHKANNSLRIFFEDKNPVLRKMILASYKKILNGEVDVLFGEKELKAAINEAELDLNSTIDDKVKKTLFAFISDQNNDVRKTLRHALFREKALIDEDGFFVLPAARKLEQRLGEFNVSISQEKFDILLTEESARENFEKFSLVLKSKGFSNAFFDDYTNKVLILSTFIRDLKTGQKFIPANSLPKSAEEFKNPISRDLFYDSSKA